MRALLREVDRLGLTGDHARRVLDAGSAPEAAASTSSQRQKPASAEPLSERELQVLRLLDSELTGPQIARELFVTVNTLRSHTKRIFTKLEVSSRRAAVRRARERGLM